MNFHCKELEPEVSNMKTAHDLFLSEETRDQKARRSVAEIAAEDDADLQRLADLAKPTIFYRKLSKLKSTCAWFMLHKRITATALSVTVLAIVAASFIQDVTTGQVAVKEPPAVTTPQSEAKVEAKVALPMKLPEVSTPDLSTSELGTKTVQEAVDDLNSLPLPPDEPVDHSKDDTSGKTVQEALDELKSPAHPPLTPVTEVHVREQTEEADPKIAVGSIAVPVNRADLAKDADNASEVAPSASDFIDQFGFGTEPKAAPTDKANAGDTPAQNESPSEDVIPIPVGKPQIDKPAVVEEVKDVRYRIVDRDKEAAGFRRMQDKNPATTQWFLVIEAVDAKGNAIPMPVMSMDSGEVKVVTKWAIQVPEKDFMRYSDEKKKTGKIANTIIGTAPSNQTEPKWTVKLTGNMLTEWE
jgi:hypothetical protein